MQFFRNKSNEVVAEKIKKDLNDFPEFVTTHTTNSTRAAGDAMQAIEDLNKKMLRLKLAVDELSQPTQVVEKNIRLAEFTKQCLFENHWRHWSGEDV